MRLQEYFERPKIIKKPEMCIVRSFQYLQPELIDCDMERFTKKERAPVFFMI